MPGKKYSKYVISNPDFEDPTKMAHHDGVDPSLVKDLTKPWHVYISGKMLPEANIFCNIGWVWGEPYPNDPMLDAHKHPYNELIYFIGANYEDVTDLGAEVEFWLGEGDDAEKFVFNTTTLIYVPKGLVHAPFRYLKIKRPSILIAVSLDTPEYC